MNFPHCHRHFYFMAACLFGVSPDLSAQKGAVKAEIFPAKKINIEEQLQVFNDSTDASAYIISLCADVPYNKKPYKVAHKQQTGHVFLVLQQIKATGDTIRRVFGYYPKKGLPTLLFKTIKGCIKDNSTRECDIKISRTLTREQFDTVLVRALSLSRRTYHINKFNCYDYAVGVFNAVSPDNPLPLSYVRFPFPFGKGGSPCSVYKDFKKMKDTGAFWAGSIDVETTVAPVSTGRVQ
jgi:hypothetical protein